ncbi:YgjV family protein [Aquimarina longa]|uniref:YgjV family protein n=1 Tax=Aquimarina longa TaxID=1080221 RepID=UPI00078469CC
MENIDWIELLGYTASIFIGISITMNSLIKLRVVNLIGAFLLGIYGVLINSIPVVVLNFFIVITNIYFLYKLLRKKDIRNSF